MTALDLAIGNYEYVARYLPRIAFSSPASEQMRLRTVRRPARRVIHMELHAGLAILDGFAKLGPDWDGYGALPLEPGTIANAKGVLAMLLAECPFPDLVPNSNGTISFEWESGRGIASLEVGATRFALFIKSAESRGLSVGGVIGDLTEPLVASISAILFPAQNSAPSMTRIEFRGVNDASV
jgi:hypothetical protein